MKKAAKSEPENVDITQTVKLQMDFFGAETTLCIYYTVLENVTI